MIHLEGAAVVVPSGDEDRTILHPTTLTLEEPRIALIGANGSGKSTLARLLNGLVVPSEGRVVVHADGTPLDTVRDGATVRRNVGFVFTDPQAQLVMPTVLEDVALSLRRFHKNKQERRAAAAAHLDAFGLGGREEQSVHTLSGGQQQLLAIASVLAVDPQILVADEPTTLLDLRNSRMIADLLLSLPQQVIVATHDLDFATRCDRALVIDSGSIAFDGNADDAVAYYRRTA